MLGSGATGEPKYPLDQAITLANKSKAVRVAVDIPTGLDADLGCVSSCTFQADLTCTFVAPKLGFTKSEALKVLGQVNVCSIGIPQKLLDEVLA
jgi:NAD(P)H-hydrate epimerase